jgi:hypothetical protein
MMADRIFFGGEHHLSFGACRERRFGLIIRPKICPNIKIKIERLGVQFLSPLDRHILYSETPTHGDNCSCQDDYPEEAGLNIVEKIAKREERMRKKAMEENPELRRQESIFSQHMLRFEAFVNNCTEETVLMFKGRLFWLEANDTVLPFQSICTFAPFLRVLILTNVTVNYSDLQLLIEYQMPISVIGKIERYVFCNFFHFLALTNFRVCDNDTKESVIELALKLKHLHTLWLDDNPFSLYDSELWKLFNRSPRPLSTVHISDAKYISYEFLRKWLMRQMTLPWWKEYLRVNGLPACTSAKNIEELAKLFPGANFKKKKQSSFLSTHNLQLLFFLIFDP